MKPTRTERVARFIRPHCLRNSFAGWRESLHLRFDRDERLRTAGLVASIGAGDASDLMASRQLASLLLDQRSTPGTFGRILRRREAKTANSIAAVAEILIYVWRHGDDLAPLIRRRDC
jgi:hypothetical protein